MLSVGELWMSLEIKGGEFTEEPLTLGLYLPLHPESCKLRWVEMQAKRCSIWNLRDSLRQRVSVSNFAWNPRDAAGGYEWAGTTKTWNRPTDGVCQAWSVIWCDGGRTFLPLAPWELNPRLRLLFSPLPGRDGSQNKNTTLFLAARLRRVGGGEKRVQRTNTHT